MNNKAPLIVITGPTGSGKTGMAVEMARRLNGEIICVDSRTVYKGMNIGTAKPTMVEQKGVPHWGLDLVEPNERYTLYDFQQYAFNKIADIQARGKTPFLVGGTGLYIDSVIHKYELSADGSKSKKCVHLDDNTVVIGIKTDKNKLCVRCKKRAEQMLKDGLIDETMQLFEQYGDVAPLRHNAYGVIREMVIISSGREAQEQLRYGEYSVQPIIDKLVRTDMLLVKKQLTWWRSPKRVGDVWWRTLSDLEEWLSGVSTTQTSEQIAASLLRSYHAALNK